jgi:hypothetical protein
MFISCQRNLCSASSMVRHATEEENCHGVKYMAFKTVYLTEGISFFPAINYAMFIVYMIFLSRVSLAVSQYDQLK